MKADDRPATELFDALPLGKHHPGESVTNQGRVALAGYPVALQGLWELSRLGGAGGLLAEKYLAQERARIQEALNG